MPLDTTPGIRYANPTDLDIIGNICQLLNLAEGQAFSPDMQSALDALRSNIDEMMADKESDDYRAALLKVDEYTEDGHIEVDENPMASMADDAVYLMAWVRVPLS